MPYPSQFQDSLRRIEESRPARLQQEMQRLTEAEKAALLEGFHPDYRSGAMLPLPVGVNRGERVPRELHNLLIAGSRADRRLGVDQPDAETDVLVIGAGGAGATAALFAHDGGARVLVATKLRANDSNTVMATGMVTGSGADDSPILHYLDTMGGGRYANVPELVAAMVHDGPIVTAWLEKLGVLFDRRPDGTLRLGAAGGYSRRRSVSAKDFTGLEIMRTLREELKLRRIPVWEFSPAVELLLDVEGRCAGAVLQDLDSGHFRVVRARKTILTTGGMGRLHVQGFPTSNHYGATADGLVMAYRAGARLIFMDSVQFHPTGVVWPEQMFGWLVTERCRGLGGQLLNIHGARFIYERETRDAVASAIIRECEQGRGIVPPHGKPGVWLDTPLIDQLLGRENRHVLSALANRFARYDIDVWKEPILVYPTQHYQNGGILTDVHGQTNVPNLYAAGEVAGGVHGRNRLGGNSLLDIFVFGRRAGIHAASYKLETEPGVPGLHHLVEYEQALIAAGVAPAGESPILLPRYAAPDRRIANDT